MSLPEMIVEDYILSLHQTNSIVIHSIAFNKFAGEKSLLLKLS